MKRIMVWTSVYHHYICSHWFDTILTDFAEKRTKWKQTDGVPCTESDDGNQQDAISEHVA